VRPLHITAHVGKDVLISVPESPLRAKSIQKYTEKKTLFWFTETEMFSLSHALLERFLGFSPFAFRSFRCLTARLDISVSSSFYVVFGNFASNAFPGFCAGCTGWLLKWPGLAQMSKTHVFMGSELKNENT